MSDHVETIFGARAVQKIDAPLRKNLMSALRPSGRAGLDRAARAGHICALTVRRFDA
jgi:hypothetical protein